METTRRPHYWATDSLHLFERAEGFYLQVSNRNLLARLRSLRAGSRAYEKDLVQYPAVLCAPLDLFYLFRRAACTLDEELLQDLLFSYGWREANWGAWLAALAPDQRYAEHLSRRRPTLPNGEGLIDLALAACNGSSVSAALTEHGALLSEIRHLLAQLPRVLSPLRIGPDPDEESVLKSEMEAVRAAYRAGGAPAARSAMRQRYLSYYFRGHLDQAIACARTDDTSGRTGLRESV